MQKNPENSMKIIVAHPGRQHSFRVAKALKDTGLLYKYATTVYNKDSSLLMRFVKLFLGKNNYARAQRRKCPSSRQRSWEYREIRPYAPNREPPHTFPSVRKDP